MRGRAALEERRPLAPAAEPEVLVVHELGDGEAVVALDEVELRARVVDPGLRVGDRARPRASSGSRGSPSRGRRSSCSSRPSRRGRTRGSPRSARRARAPRRPGRGRAAAPPSVVGVQSSVPNGSATSGAASTSLDGDRAAVVRLRVARRVLVVLHRDPRERLAADAEAVHVRVREQGELPRCGAALRDRRVREVRRPGERGCRGSARRASSRRRSRARARARPPRRRGPPRGRPPCPCSRSSRRGSPAAARSRSPPRRPSRRPRRGRSRPGSAVPSHAEPIRSSSSPASSSAPKRRLGDQVGVAALVEDAERRRRRARRSRPRPAIGIREPPSRSTARGPAAVVEATRHEAHPVADRHAGRRDDLAVEAPAAVELDDGHAGRLARGVDVVARLGDDGARAREALDLRARREPHDGARRPLREDERSAARAPEPLEPQVLTALAPAPRARLVRRAARSSRPRPAARPAARARAPRRAASATADGAVERLDVELLDEAARARDETAAGRRARRAPARARARRRARPTRGRDVVAGPAERRARRAQPPSRSGRATPAGPSPSSPATRGTPWRQTKLGSPSARSACAARRQRSRSSSTCARPGLRHADGRRPRRGAAPRRRRPRRARRASDGRRRRGPARRPPRRAPAATRIAVSPSASDAVELERDEVAGEPEQLGERPARCRPRRTAATSTRAPARPRRTIRPRSSSGSAAGRRERHGVLVAGRPRARVRGAPSPAVPARRRAGRREWSRVVVGGDGHVTDSARDPTKRAFEFRPPRAPRSSASSATTPVAGACSTSPRRTRSTAICTTTSPSSSTSSRPTTGSAR